MSSYVVESPVKYGGKIREIGETVEMPAEVGDPLVELGRLKKGKAAKTEKPLSEVLELVGNAKSNQVLQGLAKDETRKEILDAIEARKKVFAARGKEAEALAKVAEAKTQADLDAIAAIDDRKKVVAAIEKKRKELPAAAE
jgi:hypothetical protein